MPPSQAPHPLKIWQIAETYPPEYGGGAAMYVRDVCYYLAQRGHDVRVLCAENRDAEPYSLRTDRDGPVRVERLNLPYFRGKDPDGWNLSVSGWKEHAVQTQRVLENTLRDWRPDIVQFHTPRPIDDEAILFLQEQNIPTVAMLHCAGLICPRLNLVRSPLDEACSGPAPLKCLECVYSHHDGSHLKALIKLPWRVLKLGATPYHRVAQRRKMREKVRGVLSVSDFMMKAHQPHLQQAVRHIPLGIDLSLVTEQKLANRVLESENPRLRFGFMAGFQPHKGIWLILEAAKRLKARGLNFELHVWGPHQEERAHEIESRDLTDRVFLRGLFAPDDKWDVYREVDVVLMATTVVEALGRVVMEAAAVGRPTIAPRVGGIPEMIRHGENGLLFEFLNGDDLETQMARVLEEPHLMEHLRDHLQPPRDTRDAVIDVERFYYEILGLAASEYSQAPGGVAR
jgi:glycosyltransferase involved in cell wall biosynthesis